MHALCLVCQPMYEASGKNIENHQLKYSLAKNIFHTTCTDIRLHLQDSTQIQASWASKRSDFYQFTYQNQAQETTAPKTTVNSKSAAPSFIKLECKYFPIFTEASAVFVLQIFHFKSYHNQQRLYFTSVDFTNGKKVKKIRA